MLKWQREAGFRRLVAFLPAGRAVSGRGSFLPPFLSDSKSCCDFRGACEGRGLEEDTRCCTSATVPTAPVNTVQSRQTLENILKILI